MQSLENALSAVFKTAIQNAWPGLPPVKILLAPGRDPAIGEFQCNNALGLPKQIKAANIQNAPQNPVEAAEVLVRNLPPNDIVANTTVEKGFINIKIAKQFVANRLYQVLASGLEPPPMPKQRVLIDFSSPNIAKEMHVGHLRSTILGECLSRVFEFCGQDVLRINHVGDWGTQFGMLIAYLKDEFPNFKTSPPPISDLVAFYKKSKKKFDEDEEFKKRAYMEVVALQGGDADCLQAWRQICEISRVEFEKIYSRLHVTLVEKGESFYNPYLPPLVKELADRGLAFESDGAMVVISGENRALDQITKPDVERLLLFYFFKTPLNENEALVALLRKVGMVKDDAGGKPCLQLGTAKKEELKPIEGLCVNSMTTQDMGRALKAIAEKLVLDAKKLKESPPKTPSVVPEFLPLLRAVPKLIVTTPDGSEALCVPKFSHPYMVRKSDGGFTYDTTDLAALRYRLEVEKVDRVIYVTDLGQEPHFQMLFAAATDAGYLNPETQRTDHVGFGLVCGQDGKKLKTRAGETEKLADLLDKAVEMSYEESVKREQQKKAEAQEKGRTYDGLSDEELRENSKVIGYGAVKYFDLRQNRTSDYKFSYDAMLDLEGNTAVHLIYAYVRMRSIARKTNISDSADVLSELLKAHPEGLSVALNAESEWTLGLHLVRFTSVIESLVDELYPNKLTDYLYALVTKFNDFYQKERVIDAPDRDSKLLLCEVAAKVLKEGLRLLGIGVVEKI